MMWKRAAVLVCVAGSAGAEPLQPLSVFRDCEACPEMVVMPQGAFMMGARPEDSRNPFDFFGENASRTKRAPGEINIIPFEHPRHKVEMDIHFAIARTETTLGEWMACVEAGGCRHVPETQVVKPVGFGRIGPKHPVVNVSFLDALEYVAWLNAQVGAEVYRLPSEAEWEYAARAGTETAMRRGMI